VWTRETYNMTLAEMFPPREVPTTTHTPHPTLSIAVACLTAWWTRETYNLTLAEMFPPREVPLLFQGSPFGVWGRAGCGGLRWDFLVTRE